MLIWCLGSLELLTDIVDLLCISAEVDRLCFNRDKLLLRMRWVLVAETGRLICRFIKSRFIKLCSISIGLRILASGGCPVIGETAREFSAVCCWSYLICSISKKLV